MTRFERLSGRFNESALDFLKGELDDWRARGRLRSPSIRSRAAAGAIVVDGRRLVDLSGNDYLGLASHPSVLAGAQQGAQIAAGATASRLVTGTWECHRQLEVALAAFHEREAARLFNSGYCANVGVLSSLFGREDLVISDALNHASIIDGCRLSRARVRVVTHGSADAVGEVLRQERGSARRCCIVTESLFSMDGDPAPLRQLADLARDFGAVLMVDEAHAVGVRGRGRGLAAEMGVVPDIMIGTLGKAFGSFGAYVAGPAVLSEFLQNRARSYVFTTALPPAAVEASRAALGVVDSDEGEAARLRLDRNASELRAGLGALAAEVGSHIVPVILGDDRRAMMACAQLRNAGVFVQGIRPPTVPEGTARLRLTASAAHDPVKLRSIGETIARLVRAI